MIKKIPFTLLGCFCMLSLMAQTTIEPTVKTPTSFAIIIDETSFSKAKDAVLAYRDVVEADGLATYIIHNNWKTATEIRELLEKLHNQKKQPLEGAVFIGDIPIPMLRDAQHLTSAFKMDQRRDWQQSSVPSDRYYDDFGLKFDFLKQDSIKPLYFYYSLRADSEQKVNPDIYTGRIKPLEKGRENKYIQLEKYLKKVVAERTQNKNNVIDKFTMLRGHGYNSESKVAWSGEQLALSQQFPELFRTGNNVRFYDFETEWPIKNSLLDEALRPDLDLLLLHHHGANDTEYLNGYKSGSDVNTSKENIKLYIRSKIKAAVDKGKDKEETIKYYMESLDVPRSWCEEALDPKKIEADSLFNLTLDVHVSDILDIKPNARFVIFDACFNGSFYEDENIVGAYVFNDGKTIATQGNTVNALQDKWPDEFLGLLNSGLRVGLWNKLTGYLDTHITGDPTYHFANRSNVGFDINVASTQYLKQDKFWVDKLNYPNADLQCFALRVLFDNNYNGISKVLKDHYFNSPYMTVRLESLRLLAQLDNDDFIEVLKASVSDSYELIRRLSIEYIERNGSDKLTTAYVNSIFDDNSSERVQFKINESLKHMNLDWVGAEVKAQYEKRKPYIKDKERIENLIKTIDKYKATDREDIDAIFDKTTKAGAVRLNIVQYRNHPATKFAEDLLRFAADSSKDLNMRISAVETLGWYKFSYKRPMIIEKLTEIVNSKSNEKLVNEALKSIKRLNK
jgi:hypothetical protein